MIWIDGLETIVRAASDVLTAGVGIVSFSLFLFAITFKNWEKVTISFTLIILSVMVIFGADAFIAAFMGNAFLDDLIKIHWSGLIFLPVFYFIFSDALLTLTGKPSQGKRKITGYALTLIGIIFLMLLITGRLIANYTIDYQLGIYVERTLLNDLFSLFFALAMILSWWNFIRAFQRTVTNASRRRMLYLIVSSLGPAVGSFPYLIYGSQFALNHSILFWLLSLLATTVVYLSLIAMTYSVSFYGLPWPDRVIKSRLFRWVMRGPITASLTLGAVILISRLGEQISIDVSAVVILFMVAIIVLFEYFVTLFAPIWERLFFYGKDKKELEKIRVLEDRLLTTNDVRQFLELTLASLCDRLQITKAGIVVSPIISKDLDIFTREFDQKIVEDKDALFTFIRNELPSEKIYIKSDDMVIFPITSQITQSEEIIGAIVVDEEFLQKIDHDKSIALKRIISRVSLALNDRQQQEDLVSSLDLLAPRVSIIQNLLAKTRRDQTHLINGHYEDLEFRDLEKWVKDALTHMWGGPKISRNPLVQLSVVQERIKNNNETPINAVRNILREAINSLKPEGERQFTNEWILYNLLDLKFIEGWKVRDIARKLALSEADLYRKQRIAISAVSRNIINIEDENSS